MWWTIKIVYSLNKKIECNNVDTSIWEVVEEVIVAVVLAVEIVVAVVLAVEIVVAVVVAEVVGSSRCSSRSSYHCCCFCIGKYLSSSYYIRLLLTIIIMIPNVHCMKGNKL